VFIRTTPFQTHRGDANGAMLNPRVFPYVAGMSRTMSFETPT
jgi:hypothetical protein